MRAAWPRPLSVHVSRARCSGLESTSANDSRASRGRSRVARRRPRSVSGMSVVPVCWPLRLQVVSPCRMAKTRNTSDTSVRPASGGVASAAPAAVMLANERDGLVAGGDAAGDRQILGTHQRQTGIEHVLAGPFDEIAPHV